MKKTLAILGIIVFLAIPKAFAEWGYKGEITKCLEARARAAAKSITQYVCPAGKITNQEVAFQVVMSLEFNKLDKKIEQDLKELSKDTNKDLVTLTRKINDMFALGGEKNYPDQYTDICNRTALDKVVTSYAGGITTENPTGDFVYGWDGCRSLVERKMRAYEESAWLLGEIAVVNSFKNDKHTYMRRLKDRYELFLNKWTTYIGQLSVIKDKWTSKTTKVQ